MENEKHPKFYPAYENIKNLNPRIYDGEMRLLDFLYNELDENYEVYYKAFLLSKSYNILVLKRDCGMLVINVCEDKITDYELCGYDNWIRKADNRLFPTPQKKAKYALGTYKECYLYNYYGEAIIDKKLYFAISNMVFFSNENSETVKKYSKKYRDFYRLKEKNNVTLMSVDDLHKEVFDSLFNQALKLSSSRKYWIKNRYEYLTKYLKPVSLEAKQYTKITLNTGQKAIIDKFYEKHAIKFRGAAGSGKTQVLKEIWSREKEAKHSVLYLTYNISLRNYIVALPTINEYLDMEEDVLHYHKFLQAYLHMIDVDIFSAKSIFSEGEFKNQENIRILEEHRQERDVKGDVIEKGYYEKVYDCDWSGVIAKRADNDLKYDTIIVDEHQDYKKNWTKNIRAALKENGKIIFAYDEKQDVYGRADTIDTGKQKEPYYTGIKGQSIFLKNAYRIPGDIARLCNEFADEFLKNERLEKKIDIRAEQGSLFEPLVVYCEYNNVAHGEYFRDITYCKNPFEKESKYNKQNEKVASMLMDVLGKIDGSPRAYGETTCILSNVISLLRESEYYLSKDKEFKKLHFETSFESKEEYNAVWKNTSTFPGVASSHEKNFHKMIRDIRKNKKYNFGRLGCSYKMCTVQSFKGFEADNIILILCSTSSNIRETSSLLYCALTRAKKNLFIINLNVDEYKEFFKEYHDHVPTDKFIYKVF